VPLPSEAWWQMNKDEARPLFGVSALCFLQCFDTVVQVTGRTSASTNLCHLSPTKVLFRNRFRQKTEGDQLMPGNNC